MTDTHSPSKDRAQEAGGGSSLDSGERRFLLLLALPSLGLSLGITVVSSLLPVALHGISGSAAGGALLGLEGLFAITMPPILGAWSDGLRTRLGPRLPFVLAGAPAMAIAIALMPAIHAVGLAVPLLILFYAGYFTCFSPHFALYIDLVPRRMRGRSQGFTNTLRELGLGLGLVGGPALLAVGHWAPFEAAALLLLAIFAVFVWGIGRRSDVREQTVREGGSMRGRLGEIWQLIRRERQVRLFIAADALWELALNALRAYVVLYFTVGIHKPAGLTALILLGVAICALLASPLAGWLADRFGELRVLRFTTPAYAAGIVVPGIIHATWVVALIPPVTLCAVVVMTLPFSVLMGYIGAGENEAEPGGLGSGIYGIARGIGLMLGPVVGGLSILVLRPVLSESDGYGAVFLVAGASIAASTLILRRMSQPRTGDGE